MSFNPTLLDPEEQRKLEEQAAALKAMQSQIPTTAPTPQSADDSQKAMLDNVLQQMAQEVASGKQTDPALSQQWKDVEQSELQRLNRPDNGWKQALAIGIPGAIGIIADSVANRGRGLGAIAGGLGQSAVDMLNRDRMERDASVQRAQTAAGIRTAKGENKFAKLSQLASAINSGRHSDLMFGNLLARQGEGARSDAKRAEDAAKFSLMYNPQDAQAANVKTLMRQNGFQVDDNLSLHAISQLSPEHALAVKKFGGPWEVDQAQRVAAAGVRGKTLQEFDLADLSDELKRREAEAAGKGAAKAKIDTAPAVNEATGETANRFAAATDKFYNDMEPYLNSMGAIQEVMRQRGKDGEIPGLSRKDRLIAKAGGGFLLSEKAQTVTQMVDRVMEMYSRNQSGAAISLPEDAKFLKQVLGDPNASGADVARALDRFYTSTSQSVRGRAAGNPEAAQSVVDNMGLNFNVVNSKVRAKKAAASKPSSGGSLSDLVTKPSGGQPKKSSGLTVEDFD